MKEYTRYDVHVIVKDSTGSVQEVTVEEYGYSKADALKAAKSTVRAQGYMGYLTLKIVETQEAA